MVIRPYAVCHAPEGDDAHRNGRPCGGLGRPFAMGRGRDHGYSPKRGAWYGMQLLNRSIGRKRANAKTVRRSLERPPAMSWLVGSPIFVVISPWRPRGQPGMAICIGIKCLMFLIHQTGVMTEW